MKRRTAIMALTAALELPTLGRLTAAAAQQIHIGGSLGLTGQYGATSAMQKRAYEMWRDEVNARGGVLGRLVDLAIVDDGSDGDRASAVYADFIVRQKVDFVFAPYSSEITARVAPIVESAGYPMLAAGASADELWEKGYRNIFGLLTTASRYSQGMLRLAHGAGLTTVAVISAPDPFSIGAAEGTAEWAPYLKLKVVSEERLPMGGADPVSALQAARSHGAQLIVVAGHLDDAVAARKALTAIDWQPPAFYATIGPSLPDYRSKVGLQSEGTFSTSLWEPLNSNDLPGASEFAHHYLAHYGIDPAYQAAAAYAAGQILEAAINAVGAIDRARVRDVLTYLDAYSILGRFNVDRTGKQMKRDEMIIQWQKGRKEIVWPEQVRTASPVFAT